MKLNKFIIENFRGIERKIEINFNNMNVFVGANDIGKSSILEALDIFFESGTIKIDKSDLNIKASQRNEKIKLTAIFSEFSDKIVIDSDNETSLKDEFLLNAPENGKLEIEKYYSSYASPKIFIKAYHPKNKELIKLLSEKKADLLKIAKNLNIEDEIEDKRVNASIRKAIRNYYQEEMIFDIIPIEINKEDTKKIYEKIKEYFPLYQLFQSDRKNEEKDDEVQNPMNFAIKKILKDEQNTELKAKLDFIKSQVETITREVADLTIEKLAEMNTEIAQKLIPKFKEPAWEKAFNFTFESDENIPLNKRGSGVRRLILLNFFRAEAERKQKERKVANTIYAFEEPETSQHPKHQQMLIDAFIELSQKNDNQIILTTHSPLVAKLLPLDGLKFIEKSSVGIQITESNETEEILDKIADNLGILPSISVENIPSVKVAICVEGYSDIEFLKNINKIEELKQIVDLTDDKIILIFLGGSTLQFWVDRRYLQKLNLTEIHIYDSDSNAKEVQNRFKYKKYIDKVIKRGGGNYGFLTSLAETENYVHPKIIEQNYNIETYYGDDNWLERWKTENPAKLINEETIKLNDLYKVDNSNPKIDLVSERTAKKELCGKLSKQMTKEYLEDLGVFEEVKSWFESIKNAIN